MWLGRIRKHSTSDAVSTAITVSGMSTIRSPNCPPMATRPKKAISVVSVAEKTGSAMRRAAFSAAVGASSPRCRIRASACSPTTMASSTIIPSVMISAKSEIMLIVSPATYISATVASRATGMPAATQKAVRALRNRKSSARTSPSPVSPLASSMSSRPEMNSDRVRMSDSSTPCGRPRRISATTSSTRCWMPMASPLAVRSTRIDIAGFPPTKYCRSRATPSTRTLATSPTLSRVPSGRERRVMAAMSAAARFSTPVRTRAPAAATSPAGAASTSAPTAAAISAMEMSWAMRLTDGTSTTVRGAARPRMAVRVTPASKSLATSSSARRPS